MTRPALPLLAALGLLAACGGGWPGPAMPAPMQPSDRGTVAAWAPAPATGAPARIRFRWGYDDEKGHAGGRGSIILVGADSLRLDFRGPLGSGSGAAMVVGDAAIWAEPEDRVEELVPNYPILWAMLGRVRHPAGVDRVESVEQGTLRGWRYVVGSDTTEYILVGPGATALAVDIRRGGDRVGRVYTVLGPDGWPVSSRLDVPSRPARLVLEFYDLAVPFAPDSMTWVRPADDS